MRPVPCFMLASCGTLSSKPDGHRARIVTTSSRGLMISYRRADGWLLGLRKRCGSS